MQMNYSEFKTRCRRILPHSMWMGMVSAKNGVCLAMEVASEWVDFKAQWFKAHNFAKYQPLPWIGKGSDKRGESTIARWDAIKREITIQNGSAMDIGCNLGFFVLSLAEMGFYAIGIDMDHSFKVISQYVQKKTGSGNSAFSTMQMTPDNIGTLPAVDIVIFLSVWHHWIKAFGYEKAKDMFKTLWKKTNHTLFFESGEDSEVKRLGINEEPVMWLKREIGEICEGGSIKALGTFDKGTHKKKRQDRTLFAITRDVRS